MPKRFALVAFVLAASPSLTMAGETVIGDASISLPVPSGFCELSEGNASEKRALSTLGDLLAKAGNKLLGMSAECGQLAGWHGGGRLLDDYAQYQTPIATLNSAPSETVAQSCAALRAQGDKILANQLPDIKTRVEKTLDGVKMGETAFLGVLAEDPGACYAGLIQKIHTQLNTDKTQVTVFAMTIVRNKSVFTYRFGVYADANSVPDMLAKLKADIAALHAANR